MAVQIEIWLIAAVVAVGLIAAGKAIVTGLAISRRRPHHLAAKSGSPPIPPEADVPPPSG